jgi:hypothetical protein
MSNIDDAIWTDLDSKLEETIVDGVRFVRPKEIKTLTLDCPSCKTLISTVEDVESLRNNDVCEECYLVHYYKNKEKWQNGWRPF